MVDKRMIAAIILAGLLAACGQQQPAAGNAASPQPAAQPTGGLASQTNGLAGAPGNGAKKAEAAEETDDEEADAAPDSHEDRSGPTRDARCEINDERPTACSFTPVLGDGSFDIDMPGRELRIVVDGREAVAFERIGSRRIPLPGILHRDPGDPACWVVEEGDSDAAVTRVCAR